MSNSGKIAHRDFPKNFDHPRLYHQLTQAEFDAISSRQMEEHAGLCRGHKKTIVHFVDGRENRRFIVEVVLKAGSFLSNPPAPIPRALVSTPWTAILAKDAEIWILMQQLGVTSKRLNALFGVQDHVYHEDYIRMISYPHARDEFEDVAEPVLPSFTANTPSVSNNPNASITANAAPVDTPTAKKKWWRFW